MIQLVAGGMGLQREAMIYFSIFGVKLYGKPYSMENARYAFPYLLKATNITKPIFFIHPQVSIVKCH